MPSLNPADGLPGRGTGGTPIGGKDVLKPPRRRARVLQSTARQGADPSLAIAPQRHHPRVGGAAHGAGEEIDARRVAIGPEMHRLLPQPARQDRHTSRVSTSFPLLAVGGTGWAKATQSVVAVHRHGTPTERSARAPIDESNAKVGLMSRVRRVNRSGGWRRRGALRRNVRGDQAE